jgi:hypothetical protein
MHKIFNDYDGELPKLEGFVDVSWKNDACPSMLNEEREYKLWIDYVDPNKRECGGMRYTLCAYDESEDQYLYLFSSESLSTIEDFLK